MKLKTRITRRNPDTLGKAGKIISTVSKLEAAPEKCGEDCLRIVFETPFGTAGALYNLDSARLSHLIESTGVNVAALDGDEYDLKDMIGRRAQILWAWQRGSRRGVFPKALIAEPVTDDMPNYLPLTAEEWAVYDCDKTGMIRASSLPTSATGDNAPF